MKKWDNRMVRKSTCKHDTTNDSCSDSDETSDF